MADNEKLQKVGVIKVEGGQIVDVLYVGGSMFKLNFPGGTNDKPALIDKAHIDMLVGQNKLKLTSEDIYQRICDGINPETGETKDHHADGTRKTEVERVLQQLNAERPNRGNEESKAPREPEHGRAVQPHDESDGNEVAGVMDESAAHSMTRRRRPPTDTDMPQEAAPFSQEDVFGDVESEGGPETARQFEEDSMGAYDARNPQWDDGSVAPDGRTHADGSGNLSLKMSPTKRGIAMVGIAGVMVVGCIACFVGTAAAIQGIGLRVADIPVIGQILADSDDRRNLPINEQVKAGERQATIETTSGMEVVVRSDFDPETAVIGYKIADDASRDVATKFFQAVRTAYAKGDLNTLNAMIAYDEIHTQIANAYAVSEQQRLGLTEEAKNTLASQYVAILNQCEGNHVANHDLDASIYCGRVRETRVDDDDPNKLYVVTESLGGDHQRACFVLQGDSSGAYAVVGMVNPEGYVKMIMAGTI